MVDTAVDLVVAKEVDSAATAEDSAEVATAEVKGADSAEDSE